MHFLFNDRHYNKAALHKSECRFRSLLSKPDMTVAKKKVPESTCGKTNQTNQRARPKLEPILFWMSLDIVTINKAQLTINERVDYNNFYFSVLLYSILRNKMLNWHFASNMQDHFTGVVTSESLTVRALSGRSLSVIVNSHRVACSSSLLIIAVMRLFFSLMRLISCSFRLYTASNSVLKAVFTL